MAALAAPCFRPFQHPAPDSCRAVLCTKCHLSYYKFAAEYSADPEGPRTKRESGQAHLGNAKRESPQSFQCEAFPDAGAPSGTRTAAIARRGDGGRRVSESGLIYLAAGSGLSP